MTVLGGVRASQHPARDADGGGRTPPSIAILVPVLARPANAQPLVDSLVESEPDALLTFLCSPGDTAEIEACELTGMDVVVVDFETGPGDYARKINLGYRLAFEQPYVLCAADDLRFHPGWDVSLLAIVEEFDVGVVGTNDKANPSVIAGRHSTHPLVARAYIDAMGGYVGGPGKVYFEGYDHQMVDSELVETAKARGCYAHCHASVIEHRHPIFDRSVARDATYRKGQRNGAADRALFDRRSHLWKSARAVA